MSLNKVLLFTFIVSFLVTYNSIVSNKEKKLKFRQNIRGEKRVVCPKGYHFRPNTSFTQASCIYNMKFCKKYDSKLGSCL